jgi:tight adherence protein C
MIVLLAAGLLCLLGSGLAVARVAFASVRDRQEALARAGAYGMANMRRRRLVPSWRQLQKAAVSVLARVWLRLNPKTSEERVRIRLHAAGLSKRFSPQGFLATQLLVGILFLVFGISLASGVVGSLFLGLTFGAGSIYLSEFFLSRRAKLRAEQIASALPRIIDQLTISMEAGLSFDAALAHVVERGHGPIAEEFRVMLGEMRVGESRIRALKRLSERVPGTEMATFVQAVVQSEQQGISLAGIMRAQAHDLRHRRQMVAEEKAMKAPVKMLFPIVIFILPVMFIVIIGPAFVNSGDFFK